jgi:hypothetical protein
MASIKNLDLRLIALFIIFAPLAAASADAALLDGKMMFVDLLHKTNQSDLQTGVGQLVTVGPGVELTGFGERTEPDLPALVDIDISDSSILITLLIEQPPAFLERLVFTDVMNNITPIQNTIVDPSTNWAGFDPARIGGSGSESISVNLGQLSGSPGQFVLLNVIPEPAATPLTALGAGAILRRCRRREHAGRRVCGTRQQ